MSADDKIKFSLKDVQKDLPNFIVTCQADEQQYVIEDGVSEALFKWFSEVVTNENPDAQLIFTASLQRSHRAYFHNMIQRRFKKTLEGASQGVGENRKLHIIKVGKFVKPYSQLNEEQKQKAGQLFRWVKDTMLQYSRDEIAECIFYDSIPDDLQSLWDTQQQKQQQIQHLIQAAENGDLSSIQKIIAQNSQLMRSEFIDLNSGLTPLHAAAQNGQLQIIQYLVDSGCDVDILNDKNQTPLDVAKFSEQCEAEGLLIQLGALDLSVDNFPIQSIQTVQNLGGNQNQKQQDGGNIQSSNSQGDGLWGTDLS